MSDAIPRERWSRRSSFVLAALGSAVGLGNLWRFPTVAAQNGGGAFLIPYFIALLTAGIPLLIVEFGLGHMFQRSAPMACKKANKKFEWVGWWSLGCGAVICFYYCVIMSWAWNFLVSAFTVGWRPEGKAEDYPVTYFDETFLRVTETGSDPGNFIGVVLPILIGLAVTWLVVYWIISKGVTRVGKVVMITVPLPCLLLVVLFVRAITLPGAMTGMDLYLKPDFSRILDANVWLAAYGQIFFSLSIGFGALIAYASFLPRKSDITNNSLITSLGNCGTSFFAGMVVFSIIGFLALSQADAGFNNDSIVASEYTKHLSALKEKSAGELSAAEKADYEILSAIAKSEGAELKDIKDDQIRSAIAPEQTKDFVRGQAAQTLGIAPQEVSETEINRKATEIVAHQSGPGLAFKMFPIAISKMPGIWQVIVGVLFFVMLLMLGIDSAFSLVEGLVAGLHDKFGFNRHRTTVLVCVTGFLAGIPFCTYAGLLWLDIVDHWINAYGLVGVGLMEALLIGWVYKTAKFRKYVNERSEIRIGILWTICLKVITPLVLITTLILAITDEFSQPYGDYPLWSLIVGGWLVIASIIAAGFLLMRMRSGRDETIEEV